MLSYIALAAPLCFYVYTAWLAPRPYFVREMDLEPDYYYNSLVAHAGDPVPGTHHPGTPVYYLGALLLTVSGTGVENTQRFFTLSYFVIALLTGAGLVAFVRLTLRRTPFGISLLALASILVWPPWLTFMNHFGSESFIVAFGMPTLAVFWKSLECGGVSRRRLLLASGVGVGLCLATKMTFLPVAAALGAATFAGALLGRRGELRDGWACASRVCRDAAGRAGWFLLGTVVSFAVWTAPIASRLPRVAYVTLKRPEAYPSGPPIASFVAVYKHLVEANWVFALSLIVMCGLFVVVLSGYARTAFAASSSRSREMTRVTDEGCFDVSTASICLALLAGGFWYAMTSSVTVVKGYEAGIGLRNVSACALFVPFMVASLWTVLTRWHRARWTASPWFQIGSALLALLMLGSGVRFHAVRRHTFIASQEALMTAVDKHLAAFRAPGARIAFWNGVSNDIVAREASFHFLGDMTYAFGRFDKALLRAYPDYTLFDIRYATALERDAAPPQPTLHATRSKFGALGSAAWSLIDRPAPYNTVYSDFIGESAGVRLSLIVFPEAELSRMLRQAQAQNPGTVLTADLLLAHIREHTGARDVSRETIGGITYLLLTTRLGGTPQA